MIYIARQSNVIMRDANGKIIRLGKIKFTSFSVYPQPWTAGYEGAPSYYIFPAWDINEPILPHRYDGTAGEGRAIWGNQYVTNSTYGPRFSPCIIATGFGSAINTVSPWSAQSQTSPKVDDTIKGFSIHFYIVRNTSGTPPSYPPAGALGPMRLNLTTAEFLAGSAQFNYFNIQTITLGWALDP